MDLSSPANLFGVVTGVVSVSIWAWKTWVWTQKKLVAADEAASLGRDLSRQLVLKATNPARRADIHAYIQLRAIESQGRRTRATVFLSGIGIVTLILVLVLVYLFHFTDLPAWAVILLSSTVTSQFITIIMLVIVDRSIRKLEDGWQSGVDEVMHRRIENLVDAVDAA